jgi:phosphotransferase system HPr-like phosphotransfer protein
MPDTSHENPLEEVIQERAFGGLLQGRSNDFFRLSNTLLQRVGGEWSKKHFWQLVSEAEELESFLDDHGARYNKTYSSFRELTASLRWFALSGFSLGHLRGRLGSYGVALALGQKDLSDLETSLASARNFIRSSSVVLLQAIRSEADRLGLEVTPETVTEGNLNSSLVRQMLPRNVGQQEPVDEEQKIAEVASKFLAACSMFQVLGIKRIASPAQRREFLVQVCSEEQARVYEATVHNLQSAYDTHIKNTVLEGRDSRLAQLRGHVSCALHLLESVTFLTHFVERHESGVRSEAAEALITRVVDRASVQDVVLNVLLYWAERIVQAGRLLAEELLPSYTNVQELAVTLPEDLKLHARPAALIVAVVNHYGTPVELELEGATCNAASILELLVTIGSNPEARRFVFRGDENPLQDLRLLFESGLGENGMDSLPDALVYLRGGN